MTKITTDFNGDETLAQQNVKLRTIFDWWFGAGSWAAGSVRGSTSRLALNEISPTPIYNGDPFAAWLLPMNVLNEPDKLLNDTLKDANPAAFILADDVARIFGPDGVTAVSAPGTAVSLAADDWEGLELGAELRGTGAVTTSGSPGTFATYNTGTGVGSAFRLDGSNLSGVAVPVTNGAVYLVDVEPTGGAATLQTRQALAGGIYNASITSRIRQVIVSVSSNILLTTGTNGAGQNFILHSIREILNWPAYQNTAAARPTWGRAPKEVRNLLTATEQFDNAAWTKDRSTISPNLASAPDGTLTADKLIEDTATNTHLVRQLFTAPLGLYTFTVYAKAAERTGVQVSMSDNITGVAAVQVDLTNGNPTQSSSGSWNTITSSVTALADNWYRIRISANRGAGTVTMPQVMLVSGGSTNYAGDGASGALIWGAQLEVGSTATAYQRRGATPTDITESGVTSFGLISMDGSDDALLHQLAAGGTVAVALFGRGGSYLIPSITLAAPSVLQLGPLSVLDDGVLVSGCPTGILRAVGTVPWSSRFELVGYAIMKANPTDEEKARAMRYFAAHGARGWLVEGPNIVPDTEMNGSGLWTSLVSTVISSGKMTVTTPGVGAVFARTTQNATVINGLPYIFRYDIDSISGSVSVGWPSNAGEIRSAPGSYVDVLVAAGVVGSEDIRWNARGGSNPTAVIDNVSVRPLTPEF